MPGRERLGGSWVVISGVLSPPNMGHKYGYPTYNPLITTHEPPSRVYSKGADTILGVALIVVLV